MHCSTRSALHPLPQCRSEHPHGCTCKSTTLTSSRLRCECASCSSASAAACASTGSSVSAPHSHSFSALTTTRQLEQTSHFHFGLALALRHPQAAADLTWNTGELRPVRHLADGQNWTNGRPDSRWEEQHLGLSAKRRSATLASSDCCKLEKACHTRGAVGQGAEGDIRHGRGLVWRPQS